MSNPIIIPINDKCGGCRLKYYRGTNSTSIKVEMFDKNERHYGPWKNVGTINFGENELSTEELFDALRRLEKLIVLSE